MKPFTPIASLSELGLVDASRHEDFDRLTRIAIRLFKSEFALISIVEAEKGRQFLTSAQGLPEPWATSREMPLSHSFCQHVKSQNTPLVIDDARTHPLVQANGAVKDLGFIAYLGAPIYGPDDAPIGALCVIAQEPRAWVANDISALMDLADAVTSKIKVRASLLEREQTFRRASRFGRIVERAAHEVFIFDAQTLHFIEANAGARENLGFSLEELQLMTPLDIKLEYGSADFEALIAPLRAKTAAFLEFETFHRRKDGSDYLVSIRLELHEDYGDSSFVAFCRDITEQRKLEHALEEAVSAMLGRFMMFDAADSLIFANNNDFTPTNQFNQTWAPGMTLKDVVERLANSRLIEDANVDSAAWIAEQMAKFREGEGTAYKKVDGRFIEVRQSATRDGGKILLSIDVTEQKKALAAAERAQSEAAAASQAKSEFLAGMSHEFRTPLNAVMGFGQLLEMDRPRSLTPDQKEYAQHVVKSGNHLLSLISEVLDLAGIEAGHLKLSIEPVNAEALICDVITTMGPVASKSGITLTFDTSDWRPNIQADMQRFRQVLLNLMSNAIKFNSANGSVTVRLVEHEAQARIEIVDTGPGIEETLWPKLFTPFERLGHEKSTIEGAGIGLALSKRLVEAMDGKIGFESSVGVGSTFWIDLALTESAQDTELDESADLRPAAGGKFSLLYVEDNPSNLQLMEHLIGTQPDVQMHSAPSGTLGLELAKARRPDVIVLDLNLPGMSGFDVLRHLKSHPETWNTPVLALTASAMPNDVTRGLAAGFFRYITKPLDVNAFLTAIEDALIERHTERGATPATEATECRAKNV